MIRVIDNCDSVIFNLVHYLLELSVAVKVAPIDAVRVGLAIWAMGNSID